MLSQKYLQGIKIKKSHIEVDDFKARIMKFVFFKYLESEFVSKNIKKF